EGGTRVQDPDDKVIVTYSSISTNAFEPYGECVMGNKGTLIVEGEQNAMLYGGSGRSTSVSVSTGGGGPALSSGASDGPADGGALRGLTPPARRTSIAVRRQAASGTNQVATGAECRCPARR